MLTAAAAIAIALAAYTPVVVHDFRERSPLTSVANAPVAVPGLDRDRRPAIYGRARATGRGPISTTRPTAAAGSARRASTISASSPRWMRCRSRGAAHGRARGTRPKAARRSGPAFQGQGRWSDPDAWARNARDCQSGCDAVGECDWRENALGGGVAGLAGLAGLARLRRRRRRSRAQRP